MLETYFLPHQLSEDVFHVFLDDQETREFSVSVGLARIWLEEEILLHYNLFYLQKANY